MTEPTPPLDVLRTRRDELAAELRATLAHGRTIARAIDDYDTVIATLTTRRPTDTTATP